MTLCVCSPLYKKKHWSVNTNYVFIALYITFFPSKLNVTSYLPQKLFVNFLQHPYTFVMIVFRRCQFRKNVPSPAFMSCAVNSSCFVQTISFNLSDLGYPTRNMKLWSAYNSAIYVTVVLNSYHKQMTVAARTGGGDRRKGRQQSQKRSS